MIFQRARSLPSAERGSASALFAISASVLLIGAGAAMDYGMAASVDTILKADLDAAVLTGAAASSNQSDAAATMFNASFGQKYPNLSVNTTFTPNADGTLSGTANVAVPTAFMKIVQINSVTVSASAKAGRSVSTVSKCIVSLNASVASAINDSASSAVNAPNCVVQVNSSNTKAVTLSGSAKINSNENCFVGGLSTSGTAGVTPTPDKSCSAMPDPFAGMTLPTVGACTHTNYKPTNNETLQPGVYCGGLSISSVTVTFAPGLYIIKDGLLQPSGGSKMTGSGVSFFLTGSNAGVNTSGGSSWHVTAMSTGTLAGFVFFLDPHATPAGSSTLSGTSELYFEGVLYFARQKLDLSGGSSAYTSAPFTAYIADTYTLSGSSNLNINSDPTKTTLPIPSALIVNTGNVRLMM